MSLSLEVENISSNTEIGEFHWGKDVPKDLQEPATLVSKLAIDLFKKLRVHPNVYIPANKNLFKGWCKFRWTSDEGRFGSIDLNRDIVNSEGKKREIPKVLVSIAEERNQPAPLIINQVSFSKTETGSDGCQVMPEELHKEAENLVKVACSFFKKLSEHPDVILIDNWERFCCYDKHGNTAKSIHFFDGLADKFRGRLLNITGYMHF